MNISKPTWRRISQSCATHSDNLALESAEFALARVPVLRPEHVAACIWEPDARRIDVHSLFQGYLRGCRQRGGKLVVNARVQSASFESGAWSVTTPAGNFRGRVLVNAAGAWADEVAKIAGAEPAGLTPLRRTVCIVATESAVDSSNWPAVTDAVESFYFVPDAGHLLLSPADETPAPAGDAYPDDLDVAHAVDRMETATTLQVSRVVQQWAGLRTFSPDRSPVVGFDARVKQFLLARGAGGLRHSDRARAVPAGGCADPGPGLTGRSCRLPASAPGCWPRSALARRRIVLCWGNTVPQSFVCDFICPLLVSPASTNRGNSQCWTSNTIYSAARPGPAGATRSTWPARWWRTHPATGIRCRDGRDHDHCVEAR